MPIATRLLTLLHVSDLHIGEIDPKTGDAHVTALARKLLAQTTWFDGVLGHHSRALDQLTQFWNDLRKEDPSAKLVVSGDITSCGGGGELRNADAFLGSTLHLPVGKIGLGVTDWRDRAIPGNHDHWPGTASVLGGPTPALTTGLLSAPFPYVHAISRPGLNIELIGIDTDADVPPVSLKRLFAIGSFQSQLVLANGMLKGPREGTPRVLLLHHSWHKRGLLSIDQASRAALAQFLDENEIRLILTGHVHKPRVKPFRTSGTKNALTVHECRCGTTTQVDKPAYDWRTLFGKFPIRPDWPKNSLLVHRVNRTSKGLQWHVDTYTRARRGFTVKKGPGIRIPL
jgi:hypothetical protein